MVGGDLGGGMEGDKGGVEVGGALSILNSREIGYLSLIDKATPAAAQID